MAGIRIPALSGRSEAATGDDSLPGLWSLVSPSAPNRGNPIKPGGLTDSRSEPGKRPIDGKDSLLRSFRLRQPPRAAADERLLEFGASTGRDVRDPRHHTRRAKAAMKGLLLTIRWAANQRVSRSQCLQGKWLATRLRTSRPKLPRRSSAMSRRHLVNTLRSWVHCAQPVAGNHLVVSTVWLGSPKRRLSNCFSRALLGCG